MGGVTSGGDYAWVRNGFQVVPHLKADWLIAYKRNMAAVAVENIGSDDQRSFLDDVRGGPACPVTWGPDARTLFTTRGHEIVAIDIVDGSTRPILSVHAVWILEPTPDGDALIFRDDTGALRRVKIATGAVETLTPNVWQAAFDWAQGAAYFVRSVPKKGAEIWRIGLEGSEATLLAHVKGAGHLSLSHDRRTLAIGDWYRPSEIKILDLGSSSVRALVSGNDPAYSPVARSLACHDGGANDESVSLVADDGATEMLFASPGPRDSEERDGGWGGRASWSPDGRFLAVTACRARFDHQACAEHNLGHKHRHLCWSYENKRAVFDFERREVIVRDGYWSEVAWRPRATS
jgi:hypothetical protein